MIALPSWCKKSNPILSPNNNNWHPTESRAHYLSDDTPIFCAGGCGDIVGYLPKGHKVLTYHGRGYEHWCANCESEDLKRKEEAKAIKADPDSHDLLILRKQDPKLARLRVCQASTVPVILLGSAGIVLGSMVGVYAAMAGTAGWFGFSVALRYRERAECEEARKLTSLKPDSKN